jgi:TPR repeat protein
VTPAVNPPHRVYGLILNVILAIALNVALTLLLAIGGSSLSSTPAWADNSPAQAASNATSNSAPANTPTPVTTPNPAASPADTLNAARAAYAHRDFPRAAALLQPLAAAGNAEAQYHLSLMAYGGHGLASDPHQGFSLLQQAAAQGFPPAELGLYTALSNGLGTSTDPVQAQHWLQLAADHRLPEAQDILASRYFTGSGLPHDAAQAELWWLRAAVQGRLSAQRALVLLYVQGGPGLPADMSKAMHWATIAMNQWDGPTLFLMGALYDSGDKVAQDPVKAWTCFSAAHLAGFQPAAKPLARLNHALTPEALRAGQRLLDAFQAEHPRPIVPASLSE